MTSFQDATYNNGTGIMGSWSYPPDSLNRLATANVTWPDGSQRYVCWSYDSFGNRLQQDISSAAFSSGSNSCTA